MIYKFLDGENVQVVPVFIKNDRVQVDLNGGKVDVKVQRISSNCLNLYFYNHTCSVYHAEKHGKQYIFIGGESYCFQLPESTEDDVRSKKAEGRTKQSQLILSAPMPGNLLQINVHEGDLVEEGQCLAVIEAMKMETGLHSSLRARVKKIYTEVGHQVEAGEKLIELEQENPIIKEGDEGTC